MKLDTRRANMVNLEKHKSIKLDVGCGTHKQKGFVGMDQFRHKGVDVVHDIQKFPWPIQDNICSMVVLSHVWEHIEPKYRFDVMEELFRITKQNGQLWIECPYAGSWLEAAHPAHYMCPNEATFQFFDPKFPLYWACSYQRPSPWDIIRCEFNVTGTIEVVMEPKKTKTGKALIPHREESKTDDKGRRKR